jgi:hypothetical protein
MNKKILFKSALKYLPLFLIFAIIASFAFIGAECSTLVNGNTSLKSSFYATWILKRQTGRLLDICPGEITIYKSSDVFARLICPPYNDTLVREYYVNDNDRTITFKPSQVAYKWEFKDSAGGICMNLYGLNVDRNLYYQEIDTSSSYFKEIISNGTSLNSSEFLNK